jgi:serine kinase of HPr protein (carbohydrate metabolism regulator)
MNASPPFASAAADMATLTLHATTIAIDGAGVLLRGPSGSGKSDLALRLIDGGAALVADDQTELRREGDRLLARAPRAAPAETQGRIEVRGLGIVAVNAVAQAPLCLILDLTPDRPIDRLPLPAAETFLGVALPMVALRSFEASAAAKVRLALRTLHCLRETPR